MMGRSVNSKTATANSPCGDASIAEPGISTAGTVGPIAKRNEMAKKSRTFWVAREKALDCWTGEVDERIEVLVYTKKPKRKKVTYIRYDPATERDIKTTDTTFEDESMFEMCSADFEEITGLYVEPGTTFRVRLERV